MWAELADKREAFIGGELQDLDPDFPQAPVTPIVNLGFDGRLFTVLGRDYSCSMSREYAGLGADGDWFVVSSQFGRFRFRRPPAADAVATTVESGTTSQRA